MKPLPCGVVIDWDRILDQAQTRMPAPPCKWCRAVFEAYRPAWHMFEARMSEQRRVIPTPGRSSESLMVKLKSVVDRLGPSTAGEYTFKVIRKGGTP